MISLRKGGRTQADRDRGLKSFFGHDRGRTLCLMGEWRKMPALGIFLSLCPDLCPDLRPDLCPDLCLDLCLKLCLKPLHERQ